jgi:hypothetical protein
VQMWRHARTISAAAVLGYGVLAVATLSGSPAAAGAGVARCAQTTVVGVAHQDDDLLLINPAVQRNFAAGQCIRVIYLTAGDAGEPGDAGDAGYYIGREQGVEQAYAQLAGIRIGRSIPSAWTNSDLTVDGHRIHSTHLDSGTGRPDIQLVFLRLPDGFPTGTGSKTYRYQSLLKLFQHRIPRIRSVDRTSTYTESALVSTLTELIEGFRATSVQTLDYANTVLGYSEDLSVAIDHSDHDVTARYIRIATLAARSRRPKLTLSAYQGYGISTRPVNLSKRTIAGKTAIFKNYDVHDDKGATTCRGVYCTPNKPLAHDYANWLRRNYLRPTPNPKPGTLVSWIGSTKRSYADASLCIARATRGHVVTAHCTAGAASQQWRLTNNGAIRSATGTTCLHTGTTTVTTGSCTRRPARWTITAIGQLRAGNRCLTQDDLLRTKPTLHLAACTAIDPGQYWFAGSNVIVRHRAASAPTLANTGVPLLPLSILAGALLLGGLALRCKFDHAYSARLRTGA